MNSGENKLRSKRWCGPKYVTSDLGVRSSENIVFTWTATQQILPSAAEECRTSERSYIKTIDLRLVCKDSGRLMWYCVVGWLVRRQPSDDVCLYRSRPESPVLCCCHLWFYPLDCRLDTKCTQAWSFLQQFLVVQSNNITNFIFVLDTNLSLCSQYIVFQYAIFYFQIWLDLFFFFYPCQFCLSVSQGQKNGLEMLPALGMGVRGPLHWDKSNNTQQLLQTIIIQIHFILISAWKCIFLFSKIVGFHFHEEWKIWMKSVFFLCLSEKDFDKKSG